MRLHLKLNLKVLHEIREDLLRVDSQLVRFRDPVVQQRYREEVKKLREAAKLLYDHYKTILESQV